jgi:hypothetical protein
MGNGLFLSRIGFPALVICLLAPCLTAKEIPKPKVLKHSFALGGGSGIPGGDLSRLMSSSALVRLGYGYRLRIHLQLDLGLDAVMRAAGISISQQSLVGEIRVRDDEIMVPFGGRAILPVLKDRLEVFAGGGGAYLRYEETAEIPGVDAYNSFPCPSCTSRDGWGYYATAGINVALHRWRSASVGVGVETRYFKGNTSGKLLGAGASFGTSDSWFNPTLNMMIRF